MERGFGIRADSHDEYCRTNTLVSMHSGVKHQPGLCFEALPRDPVLRTRFDKAVGGIGLDPATETRLAVPAFLHNFAKLNT